MTRSSWTGPSALHGRPRMLLELSISDFAIIERASIRFSDGLNALTGETGAGKSILLDALGAVLGARVSSDLVRTGATAAHVEGAFSLDATARDRLNPILADMGIETDDEDVLVLARDIMANGRSSARINGRLATAGSLGEIGSLLVDIHGQSDHLAILKQSEQRNLLDRFAGSDSLRAVLAADVREWRDLRQHIADLARGSREREQRLDLLRFQADEIDAGALVPGEEASLATERDVLRSADRLRADAVEAHVLIAGSDDSGDVAAITSAMRQVVSLATDIGSLDPSVQSIGERANEILVLAEDLARDLRDYAESVESDEQRLTDIEDRLDLIQSLKRKYGATIEEVLVYEQQARAELDRLSSSEFDPGALESREHALARAIAARALELSAARQDAASSLAATISQSIEDLNMGRAQVQIDVTQRDERDGLPIADDRTVHVDETGIDQVEFLIAPNAGEALKPLTRIASGGETARLMLAAKSILSSVDLTPTLVFDEIDVGVGGRSGQVVGEKLWGISRQHQVIVVTHLPQIASYAETHLRIEKASSGGRTVSQVRSLDAIERESEIAAMLDGTPITESARQNARTMLERSQRFIASVQAASP